MTYSAASIANSFLNKTIGDPNAPEISPMKIQKLLYLTHGYYLVEADKPLLDELFEAWKFGPVLPSLYHECKRYGRKSINGYLVDWGPGVNSRRSAPIPTDPHVCDIIDFVWREYGGDSAIKLSDWTHVRGGPWDRVTNSGQNILRNQDIPNDLIAEYFRQNLYSEEASNAS